jgi:hypothetical protein
LILSGIPNESPKSPQESSQWPIRLSRKSEPPRSKETLRSLSLTVKENFKSTQGLLYTLVFIFAVTFLLFPATVACSDFNFINNMNLNNTDGWYRLIINFIFSLFDTIGRLASSIKAFDLEIYTINVVSAARIIFIATFLLTDF